MREKLPGLFMEQKLLSELDPVYEKYFSENPSLAEETGKLKADSEKILADYPPQEMAEKILRRISEQDANNQETGKTPVLLKFTRSPVSLLVAAALALLVGTFHFLDFSSNGTSYNDGIRLKGHTPQVSIYREMNGDIVKLAEKSKVKEHDLLQIEYNAGDYSFGILLSIDGRGVITLHLPQNFDESQTLVRGAKAQIPFAYELDDAPDFERFFFLFSRKELAVDDIMEKAETLVRNGQALSATSLLNDKDVYQSSILLLKEND